MRINVRLHLLKSLLQLALPIIITFVLLDSLAWAIPPIPEIPSFPSIQSNGNTYHVNKGIGNDSYSTTQAQNTSTPWATIQHGVKQLSAGDTLIIHEAATPYSEIVTISVSGTSWNNAVTIKGADGERPEVSGAALPTASLVNITNGCSYLYIKNLYISYNRYSGINIRENCNYIAVDDVEVAHATVDNQKVAFPIGKWGATQENQITSNIFFRNCSAHDNGGFAFNWYNRTHDLLFENCVAYSNGNEGFNGNGKAYPTGTGPTTDADAPYNIYIIGCTSHDNLESDGIDTGDTRSMVVIKDCTVYNAKAEGIKVWGDEAWFINNMIYENQQSGINLKPFHVNSKYYMLHNTLVNNYKKDSWKHELRVFLPNSALEASTCSIYLYDNIFATTGSSGSALIGLEHNDLTIVESKNNCFFRNSPTDVFYRKYTNGTGSAVLETYYMNDVNDAGTGKWQIDKGFDLHSIQRSTIDGINDPGFTDLASDDYSLVNTSLAIDAGVDVGVPTDIIGNPRTQGSAPDIGAYERHVVNPGPSPPQNIRIQSSSPD